MFLEEGIERQLKVGQAEVVEQLSSRLTRYSRRRSYVAMTQSRGQQELKSA